MKIPKEHIVEVIEEEITQYVLEEAINDAVQGNLDESSEDKLQKLRIISKKSASQARNVLFQWIKAGQVDLQFFEHVLLKKWGWLSRGVDEGSPAREHLAKLVREKINARLQEKAVSKKQQQAMGAAYAARKGEIPPSELKGASKKMYGSMSKSELEDFASTKHKGLPTRKKPK